MAGLEKNAFVCGNDNTKLPSIVYKDYTNQTYLSKIHLKHLKISVRVSYGAEGTLQKRTPSLSCRFVLSSIWRRKVVREFQPKYESHLITD